MKTEAEQKEFEELDIRQKKLRIRESAHLCLDRSKAGGKRERLAVARRDKGGL